jgi:DNA (cytosine-5)-methyltransferase 1
MIHFSLFSGIGGFELAAEWMGWRNLLSCDINEFGNKVRKHYWPDGYCHTDIKTLNYETINKELSDRFGLGWRDDDIIITGGFPCQPYSMAGKRLGKDDERHLWPEMLRVIREVKPTWIVGENVHGLVNWNGGVVFNEVQTDLENEGYEVQAFVLPAASVNAPHRRDRVWIVAYSEDNGRHGREYKQRKNSTTKQRGIYECEKQGRNEIWEQSERFSESGTSANPTSIGLCGDGSTEQPLASSHRTQFGMGGEAAAHPESRGIGGIRNESETAGTSESVESFGSLCGIPPITDTDKIRLSAQEQIRELGRFGFSKHNQRNTWAQFPTQSPVCGRDDGLPNELDGITFPKWRNESIKAYGNAVVPQVVYQIFKTIQQYEHTPIK